MPRNETVLQVFVASPSDVRQERDALEQVITELNTTWSRTLHLRLELVRWESHAYQGFGDDAQSVIDEQIPSDYDVFIGILWARFGTPTGRAASGTEEDFGRPLSRFRADRRSVQLMMYFKNSAPADLDAVEPQHLQLVRDFRSRVPDEGGLHWTFSSVEQFAGLARLHLSKVVQQWNDESLISQPPPAAAASDESNHEPHETDEEPGLLDLIDRVSELFSGITSSLVRITDAGTLLQADVVQHTSEMSSSRGNASVIRNATNLAADSMQRYVGTVAPEIDQCSRLFEEAIGTTGQLASLALDFGTRRESADNLARVADQVEGIAGTLTQSADAIAGFRNAVASSPPLPSGLIELSALPLSCSTGLYANSPRRPVLRLRRHKPFANSTRAARAEGERRGSRAVRSVAERPSTGLARQPVLGQADPAPGVELRVQRLKA